MRIAVLVNQYPKTSHSFVRREIAGLEAAGVAVERVTIRATDEPLVDGDDRAEAARTEVLLAGGVTGLATALLWAFTTRPARAARTLVRALRLARAARRSVFVHAAYVAEAARLVRSCRARGIEHVHAHFVTNAATVAWFARELGGPPFSFTAHGTNSFRDPEGVGLADKLASARLACAVSEHGKRELARLAPPNTELHVVRCGVDAAFLDAEPAALPRAPRIVCVARLEEAKGLAVLLDAAAELARRGRALELVLIGDGPFRATLERRSGELGLRGCVEFAGWKHGAGVREAMQSARVVVLPSFDEGLPVVLMEALALGRPVVATDVGAVRELVETGVCGWLVSARDTAALAGALEAALCASDVELERLGRAGRERVLARHDSRREGARLARILEASHA